MYKVYTRMKSWIYYEFVIVGEARYRFSRIVFMIFIWYFRFRAARFQLILISKKKVSNFPLP